MLLTAEHISVYYGNLQALRGVSFSVGVGEIVSLIGANGAGKSTVLKTLAGVLSPRSGRIALRDREIGGLPQHRIVRMGVSLVPEGRGIFANMTVRENLEMGAYPRPAGKETDEAMARVFRLFPRLAERVSQPAGTLSGGEQQMLAIGRALMSKPKVMLLDEPSMGLAPIIVQEVFNTIRRLKEAGITLLLVEQFAKSALEVADYAYVMDRGRIAIEGTPARLHEDARVLAAYLG